MGSYATTVLNLLLFSISDITDTLLYPPILAHSIWAAQNPMPSYILIWLINSLLIDIRDVLAFIVSNHATTPPKKSLNIFLLVCSYLSFFINIAKLPLKYMMYLFTLHQLFQEGKESISPLLRTLYAINLKTFFC